MNLISATYRLEARITRLVGLRDMPRPKLNLVDAQQPTALEGIGKIFYRCLLGIKLEWQHDNPVKKKKDTFGSRYEIGG